MRSTGKCIFCSRHRQFIKNLLDDGFAGFFLGLGFEVVKIHLMSKTWLMPITLDQIVEETREMPSEVVAELIDRILVARHGGVEPSVAATWKAETARRIEEIETGKVKGVPLEESLARARRIAGL